MKNFKTYVLGMYEQLISHLKTMDGVRTKIAKCVINMERGWEPNFDVCGQSCKFYSVNLFEVG